MEYTTPYFLQNKSVNEIHAQMKADLPPDIDVSEGSHEWNMTRPTALIVAEVCQFILPESIKLIFPSWSYGDYADMHGKTRGIYRRDATAATGHIEVTGEAGTIVPRGSLFSTASINNVPSVDYLTLKEAEIPPEGTVRIEVQCTKTGIVGNTPANTVIFVASKINGVSAVTNPEEITGGTEKESDATLIERIEDYDATQGESFVGNLNDYKRWALSVDGVGDAIPIGAQDDSGIVTIILTDSNGDPANETLREAVYNYIMRPDAPLERLAPVNARLNVIAPDTVQVGVKAIVELVDGHNFEVVTETIYQNISAYLKTALDEREVKYTRIAREISQSVGVNDYRALEIGAIKDGAITYGTENIDIAIDELPVLEKDNLILTSGEV